MTAVKAASQLRPDLQFSMWGSLPQAQGQVSPRPTGGSPHEARLLLAWPPPGPGQAEGSLQPSAAGRLEEARAAVGSLAGVRASERAAAVTLAGPQRLC